MFRQSALAVVGSLVIAASAQAHIDPSAPSLSHELAELAHEMHEYTHDEYGSSFGSHGLDVAAEILHDDLHDWSNGNLPESFIAVDWQATRDAWKTFRKTIREAGILRSGDQVLDDLYRELREAYREVKEALDDVELLIDPNAPSLSHALSEIAHELHEYTHDEYGSSFGSHGLDVTAEILHDNLHEWAEGNVSESQIECDWEDVEDAWKNFRKTIRKAGILYSGDATLDQMYEDGEAAYKAVKRALRRL